MSNKITGGNGKFVDVMKKQVVDAKKKVEEAKKEMQRVAKDAFKSCSQELFDENPELKSFGWRQYTPYWCDGEECVFNAQVDGCYVNGYDSYGENLSYDSDDKFEATREHKELCKKVSKFLGMLEDDDYKTLFGDHISVEVTRDNVKITEYEHE